MGHVKHVEVWFAPTDAEYVPLSQSMQTSNPASALYFPATHSEHMPPSGPVEPALHVQTVETELPSRESEFVGHLKHVEGWLAPIDAEYVPIPQSTHAWDPASALYFPARHNEHVSPSSPDEPALQVQAVETELPN